MKLYVDIIYHIVGIRYIDLRKYSNTSETFSHQHMYKYLFITCICYTKYKKECDKNQLYSIR